MLGGMSKNAANQSIIKFIILISSLTCVSGAFIQAQKIKLIDVLVPIDRAFLDNSNLNSAKALADFQPSGVWNDFALSFTTEWTPDLSTEYQNLFQTDQANSGLRFEVDKRGTAAVVVGTKPTLMVRVLEQKIENGIPIKINLRLLKNTLKVRINNESWTYHHSPLALPSYKSLKIFEGFSEERKAKGVFGPTQLELSFFHVRTSHLAIYWLLQYALLIAGLALGIVLARSIIEADR